MATWLSELDDGRGRRKGRKALRRMATLTLAEEGSTNPESFAQTRYAEQETCDVLLLKSIDFFPETKTCEMRLSNGERIRIPQERHRLDQRSWRNVAAKLAGQTISVPVKNAPNATAIETLETLGLHHCFHLGKNDDAGLRPAIIDENGDIKNLLRHSSDETARQNYDSELGYRNLKDPK
jgi:CRISPR-associated endonuclease/helicase Cas3